MKIDSDESMSNNQKIHIALCDAILNFLPISVLYTQITATCPNARPLALRYALAKNIRALALADAVDFFYTKDGETHYPTNDDALTLLEMDECWNTNGTYFVACKKKGTKYFEGMLDALYEYKISQQGGGHP